MLTIEAPRPYLEAMRLLIDGLTVLLPLAYALSAVNYGVLFVRQDPFAERTSSPFLAAIVGVDALYLLLRYAHFQRFPIASFPEALTTIGFAAALSYLYVERIQRDRATGVFIIGLITPLKILGSALMPEVGTPSQALWASPLFGLHALAAVAAYTAFALGAAYGVMYVLLYRSLKRRRFGLAFERFPSLDVLASMGFGANVLGFSLLSLAILLGVYMSTTAFDGYWADPKFFLTLAVWATYGSFVWAYWALGWRGTRAVALTLAGFTATVLATIGSEWLLPSFHRFQW